MGSDNVLCRVESGRNLAALEASVEPRRFRNPRRPRLQGSSARPPWPAEPRAPWPPPPSPSYPGSLPPPFAGQPADHRANRRGGAGNEGVVLRGILMRGEGEGGGEEEALGGGPSRLPRWSAHTRTHSHNPSTEDVFGDETTLDTCLVPVFPHQQVALSPRDNERPTRWGNRWPGHWLAFA